MYINAEKVNLLHVEPTTRCNASCPGCPRNNCGFGIREDLILDDIEPDVVIDVAKQFPYLRVVHLCGNLGDPIAYKHLNSLIDKIIIQNEYFWNEFDSGRSIEPQHHWHVNIQTNGSLRSIKWWQDLGRKCDKYLLRLHKITFGIDGLEDTNHIYRQATNFNKIIDNAKAFIDAGGNAWWQFLVFKHNEHQVEEARQLAKDIGFSNFYTKEPWFTKAYHWKTGEKFYLEPGTMFINADLQRPNDMYEESKFEEVEVMKTDNTYIKTENCMHIDIDGDETNNYSMFQSVNGSVMPCCHFSNNFSYKEKYDIKTLDIKKEFENKDYRLTCRAICGSIK
jgi:MoaA/NifB/PqqE/SkfB family radical SAM enzyme